MVCLAADLEKDVPLPDTRQAAIDAFLSMPSNSQKSSSREPSDQAGVRVAKTGRRLVNVGGAGLSLGVGEG